MAITNFTALVPMKGHSERVPNKNMRNFRSKPLYHMIVESLLASKYITKVVINTDSKVIADDAIKNFDRIEIIDRPSEICGDFVPMNDIIAYDLSQITGEYFLQTHSTNPMLSTSTIDKSIEVFQANMSQYDSLFSVTRLQTRLYWQDGSPVNHNPKELLRTQDLPPVYEENSNVYLFSRSSFAASGNKRIGLMPYMFEMDKLEAVDIDDEFDFKMAEMIYRLKES